MPWADRVRVPLLCVLCVDIVKNLHLATLGRLLTNITHCCTLTVANEFPPVRDPALASAACHRSRRFSLHIDIINAHWQYRKGRSTITSEFNVDTTPCGGHGCTITTGSSIYLPSVGLAAGGVYLPCRWRRITAGATTAARVGDVRPRWWAWPGRRSAAAVPVPGRIARAQGLRSWLPAVPPVDPAHPPGA